MLFTRRDLLQSGALGLAAAALPTVEPEAVPQRPQARLSTKEKFDAATVPAYRGDHAAVYQHIDANLDAHIENLRRWLRQPSVSAQNKGIREMAELVRGDLRALGCREAEIVPTTGHPCVWGYYDAGAPKTLLVYMMYDVQPVEPTGWKVPPFQAQLVENELGTVVMARGAVNQKGPERAFLNALSSILAVENRLPVNLMFAVEGEEELSSEHFPEFFDRYEQRMHSASGVFFPIPNQDAQGDTAMFLGVKGILYVELECVGGKQGGPTRAEIHGSYKAIVDAPAWRLVQALASLTTPDGNTITVPGYYDSIRQPNDEEQRLINSVLGKWSDEATRRALGVERWIEGSSGEQTILRLLCDTTLNIDGIWSGYTGEGSKTILPHKATAKVDSRLVPNQRPEQALALIRKHLDAKGFTDIAIRKLGGYPPAQTSVEAPIVRAIISVYNKYGHVPSVAPRLAGSAPYYLFTERLGRPMAMGGLGYGTGAHAPNEFLSIRPKPGSKVAGLAEMEKGYVDLIYALAESTGK